MGICQLSFLILLILQLTETICIPWLYVFLPMLIPILTLIIIMIIFGGLAIMEAADVKSKRNR